MSANLGRLLSLALAAGLAFAAQAQTPSAGSGQVFPSKAVKVVVPFSPGGSSDVVTRIVADGAESHRGHSHR